MFSSEAKLTSDNATILDQLIPQLIVSLHGKPPRT
jgi:hypothetical protein